MAKLTDVRVATLQGFFDAGDQPTEAQFDQLILWIQQGIEEHQHDSTGDGDGTGIITGPITLGDGNWIGIGVADEAIIFDAAGDIAVMGADFGVGTLMPVRELHVGDGADATFQTYVGITANVAGIAQVSARNSTDNVEIGIFAHTAIGAFGVWTNHPLNIRTNNVNRIEITAGGVVKINNLAGVGQRDVRVNADGTLVAV